MPQKYDFVFEGRLFTGLYFCDKNHFHFSWKDTKTGIEEKFSIPLGDFCKFVSQFSKNLH